MNDTYYVKIPWKVAIFHIQSAIKTAFMKEITWNLAHTFFRISSSTYILVLWKFWNLGGFFEKIKKQKKSQNFQNFLNFKNPR